MHNPLTQVCYYKITMINRGLLNAYSRACAKNKYLKQDAERIMAKRSTKKGVFLEKTLELWLSANARGRPDYPKELIWGGSLDDELKTASALLNMPADQVVANALWDEIAIDLVDEQK